MNQSVILSVSQSINQSFNQCLVLYCASVVPEESAAVPPNYKFNEARIIPLEESLHLQREQKEKLDVDISLLLHVKKLDCYAQAFKWSQF